MEKYLESTFLVPVRFLSIICRDSQNDSKINLVHRKIMYCVRVGTLESAIRVFFFTSILSFTLVLRSGSWWLCFVCSCTIVGRVWLIADIIGRENLANKTFDIALVGNSWDVMGSWKHKIHPSFPLVMNECHLQMGPSYYTKTRTQHLLRRRHTPQRVSFFRICACADWQKSLIVVLLAFISLCDTRIGRRIGSYIVLVSAILEIFIIPTFSFGTRQLDSFQNCRRRLPSSTTTQACLCAPFHTRDFEKKFVPLDSWCGFYCFCCFCFCWTNVVLVSRVGCSVLSARSGVSREWRVGSVCRLTRGQTVWWRTPERDSSDPVGKYSHPGMDEDVVVVSVYVVLLLLLVLPLPQGNGHRTGRPIPLVCSDPSLTELMRNLCLPHRLLPEVDRQDTHKRETEAPKWSSD